MFSLNKVKVENNDTQMNKSQYGIAGNSIKPSTAAARNQSNNKLVNLSIPKSLAQRAPVVVRTYVECIPLYSSLPFPLFFNKLISLFVCSNGVMLLHTNDVDAPPFHPFSFSLLFLFPSISSFFIYFPFTPCCIGFFSYFFL